MNEKNEILLQRLRAVKEASGKSYQDIADGTEEIGTPVSLATVKRVFSKGSKAIDFRYSTTLRPIARVLLGLDEDEVEEPGSVQEAQVNIEALRAVVDLKDAMLTAKREELERLEASETRKISFLRQELEQARLERDQARGELAKRSRQVERFQLSTIALLIVVIVALIVDRINPNVGYFWMG